MIRPRYFLLLAAPVCVGVAASLSPNRSMAPIAPYVVWAQPMGGEPLREVVTDGGQVVGVDRSGRRVFSVELLDPPAQGDEELLPLGPDPRLVLERWTMQMDTEAARSRLVGEAAGQRTNLEVGLPKLSEQARVRAFWDRERQPEHFLVQEPDAILRLWSRDVAPRFRDLPGLELDEVLAVSSRGAVAALVSTESGGVALAMDHSTDDSAPETVFSQGFETRGEFLPNTDVLLLQNLDELVLVPYNAQPDPPDGAEGGGADSSMWIPDPDAGEIVWHSGSAFRHTYEDDGYTVLILGQADDVVILVVNASGAVTKYRVTTGCRTRDVLFLTPLPGAEEFDPSFLVLGPTKLHLVSPLKPTEAQLRDLTPTAIVRAGFEFETMACGAGATSESFTLAIGQRTNTRRPTRLSPQCSSMFAVDGLKRVNGMPLTLTWSGKPVSTASWSGRTPGLVVDGDSRVIAHSRDICVQYRLNQ